MKFIGKLLTALLIAGAMTTAVSAETIEINGYPGKMPSAQLSVTNITGEAEHIELDEAYPGYKTYTAVAPVTVTLLTDEIFLYEAFDITDGSVNPFNGALPITHDGFGAEYDYIPYFEQEEGREYKYDQMVIAEETIIPTGRTITLKAPGIYYVEARLPAVSGAANAAIVVTEGVATYTSSKVMIDGTEVAFEAYNIADNNYFKLRDVAMALTDTSKAFNVGWDQAANSISITAGSYTPQGGELEPGDGTSKIAYRSTQKIGRVGDLWTIKPYNINGNNYFKLRDLGEKLGFDVDWDGNNNCIMITTE